MARRKKVFSGQLSDVDLRLMRVFKTVVECEGLSAAQTVLGVGRSTISKQISDLEIRLGMRLCNRGRSGFSLTQHGIKTLKYIDQLLLAAEEFKTNIASINDRVIGRIEIGMIDCTFSDEKNPLKSAIQKYKKQYPDVTINLMTGTPSEVERGVIDGHLHIGIGSDYQRLSGLQYYYLYEEEVGLLCGGEHPVAMAIKNGDLITEKDLYQHELIYRGYYENEKLRNRKEKFPIGSTCQQTEAVLALVQSGLYLGFCPVHCLKSMSGENYEILPNIFHYQSSVYAFSRTNRHQSNMLHEFINFLNINSPQ